jgi:hypothetical protein
MITNNTYLLSSKPYLFGCEYNNIVTINLFPRGPLGKIVRRIKMNRLSGFTDNNTNRNGYGYGYGNGCECQYGILSLHSLGLGTEYYNGNKGGERLMTANEIPNLFSFLLSNGYKIDTSLTKMLNTSNVQIDNNNIIAFITYG